MNAAINWLKHDTGQSAAALTEVEAGATILRAVSKFAALYSEITPTMKTFADWMVEHGHFARFPSRPD
jgi:hypothetical protein